MNKTAIKNYAIWARVNLIEAAKQRAYQYEITKDNITDANADVVSGKPLSKEEKEQRRQLIDQINRKGFDQVMEEVAYTWFNRFIALRFMEVNGYLPTKIRVFTDSEGNFKPEILKEALTVELPVDKSRVMELLEKQDNEELYKMLLIAQCNELSNGLPDMFEVISNYTELLFPNNLLKEDSILGEMVNSIPEEDWTDAVQIIGWLYQYYNSELKDETFALLKKNVKISKERIPAATQLFTPDWIVRYMVENSLGRLWYEGHPNEEIKKEWKYYLDEAQQEPEVEEQLKTIREEYKNIKPEDIKVIDPCMGSGHILVYAFDVLMQIYTSAGWSERDAAESILENNLYGLDIDDRAGQLAYFAVMMKARKYNRRILTKNIRPKVYSIQESNNIAVNAWWRFGPEEDIARRLVQDLTDAKEYGSILNLSVTTTELQALRKRLDDIDEMSDIGNLLDMMQSEEITRQFYPLVELAEVMVKKYDVVVTNPPYMGSSGMSGKLSDYVKEYYPDSKADLFAVFIEKCGVMNIFNGYRALITPPSFLFLTSFEVLRSKLIKKNSFVNLLHMGRGIFGVDFGSAAYVIKNTQCQCYTGAFFRLHERTFQYIEPSDINKLFLLAKANHNYKYDFSNYDTNVGILSENAFSNCAINLYFEKRQNKFVVIPGIPMAYWANERIIEAFSGTKIQDVATAKVGIGSGNTDYFLKLWYEISFNEISIGSDRSQIQEIKYVPINKGGNYRKWYGNNEYVIFWENNGFELINYSDENGKKLSYPRNLDYQLKESLTWGDISSGDFSLRYSPPGFFFSDVGNSLFLFDEKYKMYVLAYGNTSLFNATAKLLNQTMHFKPGNMLNMPIILDEYFIMRIDEIAKECIELSKKDWDSYSESWDFKKNPLI